MNTLYVHVLPLPPLVQPARVIRHRGMTLLWADPFVDRYELARLFSDSLDGEELATLRSEMQWPEGMIPTAWLEESGPMAVPESLWIPAPVCHEST